MGHRYHAETAPAFGKRTFPQRGRWDMRQRQPGKTDSASGFEPSFGFVARYRNVVGASPRTRRKVSLKCAALE